MSDYMKGYKRRNSRRRESAARRRRRYADQRNFNARNSYSRKRRNSEGVWRLVIALLCIVLAVVLVAKFVSGRKGTQAPATDQGQVATLPAVEPATVAAVSAEPTQTPRPKAVAITFDDGPSTVNTPKILATLKKYNAHATFFVVGERVASGADVLKQEIEQGCEIANHSWDHANLSKLSMKKVNKQFNKTAKAVKEATGGYEVDLLRPPYGAISDKMRKKFEHPMVIWSIDTLDWKYLNAKKEIKLIKKEVSDGDIILMHDIHAPTVKTVEKIIPWLIENGYDVLTVSELMERKGIKMKDGKVYASGK